MSSLKRRRPTRRTAAGWLALGLAAATGGAARPQPSSPTPPPAFSETITVTAKPDRDMSPIVVTAMRQCLVKVHDPELTRAPQIVDTYPKTTQVVPSGYLIFSIVFDRPMSPCYHRLQVSGDAARLQGQQILFSRDLRTVHYLIEVRPGPYSFDIDQDPCHNFRSVYGAPAPARTIRVTAAATPPEDLGEAARRDPLFHLQNGRSFIAVPPDPTCWR